MDFSQFKVKNYLELLDGYRYPKKEKLTGFRYKRCGYRKDNSLPKVDNTWDTLQDGGTWGGEFDGHFWFYHKIRVEDNGMPVYLSIKTGKENDWDATNPQFIVYVNGKLTQGMDIHHTEVLLPTTGEIELMIYAYNGMFDHYVNFDAYLLYTDTLCEKVYYDIKVPYDTIQFYDNTSKDYIDILSCLNKAVDLIDLRQPYSEAYKASLQQAESYLKKEFYGKLCGKSGVTAVCIGHTHIDVAWLWTLAQTREKAVRSFSTVVKLMKQYPKYKFMSSQAHLYNIIKQDEPELFAEIQQLVKQGRWEVEGAMWVEADCNLTSGESLVRQILYGKRFFQQELGVDSKVLWLPDVFGYSAALPQILQKSGVDKFVTSKISWNETNKMPYDTFDWEGIDGTTILTHFLTAQDYKPASGDERFTTYNAMLNPTQVAGSWNRYQQKDLTDESIVTFGWGDGGGGPTIEMLENAERLEKGIPGCPAVRLDTATSFLNKLEKNVKNNPKLPRWVGELYLELHRGTYTSIAKNKRNNRKSEFAYQTAELFSKINQDLLDAGYPQQDINSAWETILINQFHDILPGSSIKEVYDTCDQDYARILTLADSILDSCYKNLAKNIETEGGVLVFNPNSYDNSDVVDLDGEKVFVEHIPANGYKVVTPNKKPSTVKFGDNKMENKFFRVVFNKDFTIKSIYDKTNKRQVLKDRGNVLQAFDDRPKFYDAWEITNYYADKMWEIDDVTAAVPVTDGARAGFKITRKFLASEIEQTIYLYDDIAKIDFVTNVDWKENHILLKAAFPIDVHTSTATYDIQFGHVQRPTHKNTSWDAAKFEVCAHKFADVSEDGYGVSLLNDCKYGYDTDGSTMRISLLKCATYPNEAADKEHHSFTYSLYPHRGSLTEGGTIQMAYNLNRPMTAIKVGKQDGKLKDSFSFVSCDKENIIIETVKKAEDSDAAVVRLFDAYHRRSEVTLSFGQDIQSVTLCDMLENDIKALPVKNNQVTLSVKPFEIITLKVFS